MRDTVGPDHLCISLASSAGHFCGFSESVSEVAKSDPGDDRSQSGDKRENCRPAHHPLLGIQILLVFGLLAGGANFVIDTIRDSTRFTISAGDHRIPLGGLRIFVGAVLTSFALIPFSGCDESDKQAGQNDCGEDAKFVAESLILFAPIAVRHQTRNTAPKFAPADLVADARPGVHHAGKTIAIGRACRLLTAGAGAPPVTRAGPTRRAAALPGAKRLQPTRSDRALRHRLTGAVHLRTAARPE